MKELKVLVTSGGTKVSIDMVRSITNMSRGTFGSAIAKSFLEKGHSVDFLMAEGSRSPFKLEIDATYKEPEDYFKEVLELHNFVSRNKDRFSSFVFKTFDDYSDKINYLLTSFDYDAIVLACAASDYGVANYVDGKIRSSNAMSIELTPYPKIISTVKVAKPDSFLVGFKLLVKSTPVELIDAAKKSLEQNKCDIVVANDLDDIRNNNHKLLVVEKDGLVTKIDKEICQLKHKTLSQSLVDHILVSMEDGCYFYKAE